MQFIKADDRAKKKKKKIEKTELVKKEAVKNLRKNERKTKTKTKNSYPLDTYMNSYPLDILCHVTQSLYTQANRNL